MSSSENTDVSDSANRVFEMVKEICTNIGPGVPFSPQEAQRAEALKKYLSQSADEVLIEEFQTTNAYLGWFRPACILCLISVGFFFISMLNFSSILITLLSFLIGLFVFLVLVLEFFLSKEFIDFLFPKQTSQNLIGRICPKNQEGGSKIQRILIFSGHHDTSPEFLLLKRFKGGYYLGLVVLFATVVAVMVAPAIRLVMLIMDYSPIDQNWNTQIYFWFVIFIVPIGLACGWWFLENPKNGGSVPGAIDNLTSSCIAVEMARILKANPEYIPSNTEIRCCSWGAEEANMKGSWAYARRHLAELREKNVTVINMESICDSEITILSSDNNGFTKNSAELVKQVDRAATTAGVEHKVEPFPWGGGGTDAYGFSRYGLNAISLFSLKVPEQMVDFYHQSTDNYDKVNQVAIQNVIRIILQYLREFNSQKK